MMMNPPPMSRDAKEMIEDTAAASDMLHSGRQLDKQATFDMTKVRACMKDIS